MPGSHGHTCWQTRVIVFPSKNGQVGRGKQKVVILDELELLKHGTSRRSAAEQLDIIGFGCFAQYSRHLEDELGPTAFIIQPLISATLVRSGGVDDITGFYCTTFLLPGLEKSQNKRSGRNGTEETRTAGAAVRQTTVSTPPHRARLSFRSGGLFGVPSSRSCSTQSQRTPSVSAEPRPSQRNENRRHG